MGHREDLLAGAKRCLYERGYARTTARDIVAASGTNLASIGYHFGSKEALLNAAMMAAIAEFGDEIKRTLASVSNAKLSPMERFEATWNQVIESFAERRQLWIATFEITMQAEHSPEVRAFLAEALQEGRQGLAALFLGPDGSVDEQTTRTVGSFYQALMSGVITQWLIDPARAPSARALVEALQTVARSVQSGEATGDQRD